ncbi:hypothetical protein [Phaeocystidibacter luteus]|uniref:DUF541 domain-containing protein n=1 Tax=Phaeocystidibacter luteus TaxID=911197 RepID=A0A6N6RKZ1_9FLAO|nr:hypothetical protein [Phaeocystidibacter luteus]KAB2810077.1 hypothetical protein F8C67_07520 [Phaeocystidibacter luteus]
MRTKRIIAIAIATLPLFAVAQVRGNYDYRSSSNQQFRQTTVLPTTSGIASLQPLDIHHFTVKGMMNLEADSYLAIFTITQMGTTQGETEALVRAKTDSIKQALVAEGIDVETYIDMISFVPLYEVQVTKKIFSEDTYNEVPKGFELKKNLHFRYTDPEVLERLVALCAEQEIYDLVRVDYHIEDIEKKKAEMIAKAETLLMAEMNRHKRLMGVDFAEFNVQMADGFRSTYPIERYQTYTAYCSSALNVRAENGTVVQHDKTTSEFYMPIANKGYDFVMNASILEPVVQLEYEIVLRYTPKPEEQVVQPQVMTETEIQREVLLITANGEVIDLELD